MIGLSYGNFASSGSGFVGLLDLYPSAAAAYSVRRLSSTYAGSAMEVRIDTDGQPLYDIGFDANGDLDTADLISKAAGNRAFVRTWYDQSGNGNDVTQTTTGYQPRIVNSGVVETKGTQKSIYFSSANLQRLNTTPIPLTDGFTAITVGSTNNNSQLDQNFYNNTDDFINMTSLGFNLGAANRIGSRASSNGAVFLASGENLSSTNLILVDHYGSISSGSESNQLRLDGVDGTQSYGARIFEGGLSLGSRGSVFFLNGYISEFIYYTADKSAEISAIESNINTYFSIY